MIGSLFFEVEGALAGTVALRRAALVRALAEEGFAPSSRSEIELHSGGSTRESVRRALRDQRVASDETALTLIALRADRHFSALVHAGVSLAPGARELVRHAIPSCRLAIVTGLERAMVDSLLSLAELDGAFEVFIAA